jgi:hypoxanthine phosphoribosyltransferase
VWDDLDSVLIDQEHIQQRVSELADQIGRDLADLSADGEIVLVPILTGSIIFVADLMRRLPLKLRISVVTVASYPGRSVATHGAQIAGALPEDLEGRHVLIVDDILDSGGTIRLIRQIVQARRARSVRACVLLRKKRPAALETPCEYVGFDIPDVFVVGYGLDYNNYYRNLPAIGTLRKDLM